jgi:hypothetical protein
LGCVETNPSNICKHPYLTSAKAVSIVPQGKVKMDVCRDNTEQNLGQLYLAPHVSGALNFREGDVELAAGDDRPDASTRSIQELDETRHQLVPGFRVAQSAVTAKAPRESLKLKLDSVS